MMGQSLQRRLERLKEAVLPTEGTRTIIEIYVRNMDGTAELDQVIEVPPQRSGASRVAGKKGRR